MNHNHCVSDLGVAAYVMMHGYKVIRRQGNSLLFEVANDEINEFERLQMEYLNSEFHRFDSHIMAIKKMPNR